MDAAEMKAWPQHRTAVTKDEHVAWNEPWEDARWQLSGCALPARVRCPTGECMRHAALRVPIMVTTRLNANARSSPEGRCSGQTQMI